MNKTFKHLSPAQIIALGFASVILIGSVLLMLPCSVQQGVHLDYIDALYTSTSAVCVTGLIAVDAGDTFTPIGNFFLGGLIQIGGLGVTAVGAGIILLMGKRVNLRSRNLVKEGMNLDSGRGIVQFVKSIFITTVCFELAGAALSFLSFSRTRPLGDAICISLFHAVAAFNNSGFDILGGGTNLIPYRDDLLLNLVTCGLIVFGGMGFLVIREIVSTKFRWKKFSMHTKVVLTMTAVLIVIGTLMLKATEDITWLAALFHSVSARTAGFSTYPLGTWSNAGLLVLIVLMFIGASPGSTGGGIKTTTFFVLMQEVRSLFTKRHIGAFRRTIPMEALAKAFLITMLSLLLVCACTFFLCILEPEYTFLQLLFEEVSAFGTVGLSTGITPSLGWVAKLVLIITMFAGRVGTFTLLSIWIERPAPTARYTEESLTIG